MSRRALLRLREKVQAGEWSMTLHAVDEMEDDSLEGSDVERVLLTGSVARILRDEQTRELKYVISGNARDGRLADVVAKFGPTGRVMIITVYVRIPEEEGHP